jgi:hypothetical protein
MMSITRNVIYNAGSKNALLSAKTLLGRKADELRFKRFPGKSGTA